jgi:hypothetical protein
MRTAALTEIQRARAVPIEMEIGRRGIVLKGKIDQCGACPVCGGNDRFSINLRKQVFYCRYCDVGGDVIRLVQHLDDCTFTKALERLTSDDVLRQAAAPAPSAATGTERRQRALNIGSAARDPRGTLVEQYLKSRGLTLPAEIAGRVIRYHPTLYYEGSCTPGMVALFRDVRTDAACGIHRTFLNKTGRKLDRKMWGRASGAAIKLSADDDVSIGLHVGEGIETCLAAYLSGFHPVWALGSANGIASFPVLPGIENLTILGENNDGGANHNAIETCAARWIRAGREAFVIEPLVGNDLNDVVAS